MTDNHTNWTYVCEENEIDLDGLKRFDHEGNTFCIYHIEDGYYATDGICTHEYVHLEDGFVLNGEIECPMHMGLFDIKSGQPMSPPVCEALKTFPVKVEEGSIYIKILRN
jgi:3-phenylpropionate/trans-cinnamate dioxygenase ferredoxin subunit